MKKHYTAFIFSLFSIAIIAQPTFDASNKTLTDGDSYLMHKSDPLITDVGSGGADQKWDFRGLNAINDDSIKVLDLVDLTNTTHPLWALDVPMYYKGADIKVEYSDRYQYYNIKADGYDNAGFVWRTLKTNGQYQYTACTHDSTPAMGYYKFPLDYNDSYSAVNVATSPIYSFPDGNQNVDIGGTGVWSFTYDGYGTLILPGDEKLENVARFKIEETWTSDGRGGYYDYKNTIYEYHHTSVSTFILRHEEITFREKQGVQGGGWEPKPGSDTTHYRIHWMDPVELATTSTSINESSTVIEDVQLFPNPTNEKLNITLQLNANNIVEYSVYNILGETVLAENGINTTGKFYNHSVDVSDLHKGIYFIEVKSGNKSIIRKFQKN